MENSIMNQIAKTLQPSFYIQLTSILIHSVKELHTPMVKKQVSQQNHQKNRLLTKLRKKKKRSVFHNLYLG
ncbi:hypothetical protein Hanom_Chr10g00909841 [Helianthus anomalus]